MQFECINQARRSVERSPNLRCPSFSVESLASPSPTAGSVVKNVGVSDGCRDVRSDRRIEHVGERRLGKLLSVNSAAFFLIALYPFELRRIDANRRRASGDLDHRIDKVLKVLFSDRASAVSVTTTDKPLNSGPKGGIAVVALMGGSGENDRSAGRGVEQIDLLRQNFRHGVVSVLGEDCKIGKCH
jgi:hypothetical protein